MKLNFRVLGKMALLLVVIGFLMPVACNRDGFEIARALNNANRTFDAILMYLLFFSAIAGAAVGVLLLLRKKIKPIFDWVFLLSCIGSGLFVYFNVLRSEQINLQHGAYFILAGWIIALITQIVSKRR